MINAGDECSFEGSRFTHTLNILTPQPKAIELCCVISAALLFKAAGRQLVLIRVDGAATTTTNQHIYLRE